MKVILLIGVIFSLVFFGRNFFNLKKITCQLDNYPCPLVLEPLLAGLVNKNIFVLNRQIIIQQLSQSDPTFTNIQVTKTIPNRLSIKLNRRQPLAQINLFNNLEFSGLNSTGSATLSGQVTDQAWFIDSQADIYPVNPGQSAALPEVAVLENFDRQAIVAAITLLNSHYVGFNQLAWLDKFTLIIKTSAGTYAVVDPSKDMSSAIASLQYILNGLKIGERLPLKIDLRFNKPVLTY